MNLSNLIFSIIFYNIYNNNQHNILATFPEYTFDDVYNVMSKKLDDFQDYSDSFNDKDKVQKAFQSNSLENILAIMCSKEFLNMFPIATTTKDLKGDSGIFGSINPVMAGTKFRVSAVSPCVRKIKTKHDYFLNGYTDNFLIIRPNFEETDIKYSPFKKKYKHFYEV